MALSNQQLDELVEQLTHYKFIIIAGLLGEGRLHAWLERIDDHAFKMALQKELSQFSQDLLLMFATEDREKSKKQATPSAIEKTRDLFYQVMIGVKPSMLNTEPHAALQRKPTGMPQPGLYVLHNRTEAAMGVRHDARHKGTEKKAKTIIKDFFNAHPTLAEHLYKVIAKLKKINKRYNQFMLAEHRLLKQALEQTRRELTQTEDEVETEPEESEEEATQIFSSPEDEIDESKPRQLLKRATTLQNQFQAQYFKPPPLKRTVTAPVPETQSGELELFASSLQKAKEHLLSLR